jgi:HEPN domain-containing protein
MNILSEEAAMLHRIAVGDYKAFRKLIDDTEIDLRIAAFFGQQTIEKLFKAVLAGKKATFPPTHNLEKLDELLRAIGVQPPVSSDILKRLNPYAVVFRYDDRDIPTISRDVARDQVEMLLAWAEQQLQQ